MEMSPYVTQLRQDLAAAAAAAGSNEVARAGELLAVAVEPALRLTLLDVLGAAATEIGELMDTDVHVALVGREPVFAVSAPTLVPSLPEEDSDLTRVTLRLPESLKDAVERAAADSGSSVNAFLVNAVRRSLDLPSRGPGLPARGGRLSGFARA